jgi:putative ABC transport system permease protein
MSTHLKMLNLLAGILTMTALYSINLRIMGRPNIALLGEKTLFSELSSQIPMYIPLAIVTAIMGVLVYRFLISRVGLAVRATGSNARMGRAQGINDHKMIWLGLSFSNGLVALAGSLFAQVHGFADVTMGVGTIIIGLAAVIIGEALLPIRTVFQALIACIIGAIIYRLVVAMALNVGEFGLQASDLNLVTALLVAFAMLLPTLKRKRLHS